MRDRERAFLRFKGSLNIKSQLRREFQTAQNTFDRTLRKYERQYKRSMCNDIENMSTENPREFWNKIKTLGPRKSTNIPMEVYNENGEVLTNEKCVLNRWKTDFENIYNNESVDDFDSAFQREALPHKRLLEDRMLDPLYDSNAELNRNISFEELEKVLLKAKNGKSVGIDQIPYEILKLDSVKPVLLSLFQLVFDTSLIPSLWRKAVIFPLLKDPSSDKRVPLNYRGISLLSCLSKLYSAFVNNRLTTYLENNDVLSDEQNGFRAERSCEDHVLTLSSIIRNKPSVFATFIDLKKAFDFADRDLLLYKLLLLNIDGMIYNSIKSIYSKTTASIRVNGTLTDWIDCRSGVRQGDNCSPTLFSIFIDDLVREIYTLNLGIDINSRKISILLYADDIVRLANNESDMQTLLNTLHTWCQRWRMLINTEKSKVVHFRQGRRDRSEFQFNVGNNELETVSTYKYFGVIFNEKCTFLNNAENLAKAGGRALGSIISKIHNLKEFGIKTFEKLFNACVVPILDYCSSVWGFNNFSSVDDVQNRSIRYFLGVHRFAPKLGINGDVGWLPSKERRHINIIRYWNRLLDMDNRRLCKQVFQWDYNLCKNNWSSVGDRNVRGPECPQKN